MGSINKPIGYLIQTHDEHDPADIDRNLEEADAAFADWRQRPISEQEVLLEDVAGVLGEHTVEYAGIITDEMSKPRDEAVAEGEKCAWVCEYYAERAAEQLQDEYVGAESCNETYVWYEPLGPVLAIMS